MRAALAIGLLAIAAACENPSPALHIQFSGGPAQRCPSVDCSEIPSLCSSVLSVRMLDPEVPNAPYLSQCTPLNDDTGNVCAIGGVDLEVTRPLPLQDLEVQVAVYPAHVLARDPMTGKLICPADVKYSAVDGFPIEGAFTPALGGRTYYRPGDESIVVVLGCTNLESINPPACEGAIPVTVSATVDDFDTGASVLPHEASRLSLYVGEPVSDPGGEYDLNLTGAPKLARSGTSSNPPAWGGSIQTELRDVGCLAVFEDNPGTTTTVSCRTVDPTADWLSFTGRYAGVRLARSALAQILEALTLSEFPVHGITIGVVLDADGDPVAGKVVAASGGATVRYLSSDRKLVVGGQTTGGAMGGVFVSTDAPFGTTFSTSSHTAPIETVSAIGGRIRGKVTIVVLRFSETVVGPG